MNLSRFAPVFAAAVAFVGAPLASAIPNPLNKGFELKQLAEGQIESDIGRWTESDVSAESSGVAELLKDFLVFEPSEFVDPSIKLGFVEAGGYVYQRVGVKEDGLNYVGFEFDALQRAGSRWAGLRVSLYSGDFTAAEGVDIADDAGLALQGECVLDAEDVGFRGDLARENRNIRLPPFYVGSLAVGEPLWLRLSAPDLDEVGRATYIDNVSFYVPGPRIESFKRSPGGRLSPGTLVTLEWQTTRPDSLSITPWPGNVSVVTEGGRGQIYVAPTETTTFELSMVDDNGDPHTSHVTVPIGDEPLPNVLFVLIDDYGWSSWGQNGAPTGDPFYETPNMDAFAASGMMFTKGLATPVCTPTRAALLTGISVERSRITDFNHSGQNDAGRLLKEGAWVRELPLSETTIGERFRRAGYRTSNIGKWHLGFENHPSADPLRFGFDFNFGGNFLGRPTDRWFADDDGSFRLPGIRHGAALPDTYLTQHLAEETCADISLASATGQPFFLYLSHYAVHGPTLAPSATVQYYEDKQANVQEFAEYRADYAAMIHHMDQSLGRVLECLDDPDGNPLTDDSVADETIVVFYGDNGGKDTVALNSPFRNGKGFIEEGGVRVPLIVRWPGEVAPGSVSHEHVLPQDFYPTLLEYAQLPPDPVHDPRVDGESIIPLLIGDTFERETAVAIHYPHYAPQGGVPSSSVYEDKWKLVHFYESGDYRLYDLDADPGELTDLAIAEPEISARLSRKLVRHLIEHADAAFPTRRSDEQLLTPTGFVASVIVDADGDRVPDLSEDLNANGLVDDGETDPDNADTDGDGVGDGFEGLVGTDPLDPSDRFDIDVSATPSETMMLSWKSVRGVRFVLETSSDLSTWTTDSIITAGPGSTTSVQRPITAGLTHYYRVSIR